MKPIARFIGLPCALAALVGSAAVSAQGNISYQYAELQYFDQNLDDNDCSQDGLALRGSLNLNGDFFALGSIADSSGNKGCGANSISAGMGYRSLFGADSSIYGSLSLENISPDHGDSDSGLIAAVGLRGFIDTAVEAKVELSHHTAFDGNTQLTGAVAYWFDRSLAATGEVSLGSDVTSIALGARFNF